MPNAIVLGSQWGDEGKGKVVDRLAHGMNVVVRFQGGANAGHTVVVQDKKYVLHLLPSGILNADTVSVIGNGCVVDPRKLAQEIDYVRGHGFSVSPENLVVSHAAHMVTPFHRHADTLTGGKVGTTGRGIGPTYEDKARRTGLRLESLRDGSWREGFRQLHELWRVICPAPPDSPYPDPEKLIAEMEPLLESLAPFVTDTQEALATQVRANRSVLFEGAQGTLLDIDHGTYPFVTSSSTTIGGALTGTGVYLQFDHRIAVVKAYTTRVGNGPFPTELDDEVGRELRRRGDEFGATTGRPRRCGWLDLPLLRKSFIANGFNRIALTKLDCLSGFDPIRVAVEYDESGRPVYQDLAGWESDIRPATSRGDLPRECQDYIEFIETSLGAKAFLISTGPARHQTIEEPLT